MEYVIYLCKFNESIKEAQNNIMYSKTINLIYPNCATLLLWLIKISHTGDTESFDTPLPLHSPVKQLCKGLDRM